MTGSNPLMKRLGVAVIMGAVVGGLIGLLGASLGLSPGIRGVLTGVLVVAGLGVVRQTIWSDTK